MSFLRGKSTSYSRFLMPAYTLKQLDETVQFREFTDPQGDSLESVGFCSYRNLLDAPIERGFIDPEANLWLTGLRKDVKKAPPALVRATVARALADARQTNPGLGKQAIKDISYEVALELHKKAQARPSHAAVMLNVATGLLYVDGVASAHDWICKMLEIVERPYGVVDLNCQYLAWCAWRAGAGVDTPVAPTGDITFREPKDSGASYDGQHEINGLLNYWIGEQRAAVSQVALCFAVPFADDTWNANVSIQSPNLKIQGLEWPEDLEQSVLGVSASLDDKLALRLGFVAAFEAALAADFKAFLEGLQAQTISTSFLALFGAEPATPESEETKA